ncbi:hypothetical protein CBS101457_002398 [Exobasidium rhododendri]|nr:hypothetical protein CBS101457_002398 [Exobasidium rhododendri]
MLARWRPSAGGGALTLPRILVPCQTCRSYQNATSPRSAAQNKHRQRTINVDDLPLRAKTSAGKPKDALPEFRNGMQSEAVSLKRKGKAAHVDEEEEYAFEIPRLNELGPDGQVWPPLAKDVLINLARFPTCILLTRVGGFYESYYDQAPLLASILGIKLANRNWGGRSVPMAGFPIVQLDKYLKLLVMDHKRLVAICDEFKEIEQVVPPSPTSVRRSSSSKSMMLNETINITRRVTRVVSPGTLIDEHFLDPFSSNWMLSISKVDNRYGLAWLDVSTADFNTTCCGDEQSLRDEVARIGPTEVVLERGAFDVRAEGGQLGDAAEVEPSGNALWEVLDPAKVHISFCLPTAPTQMETPLVEDEVVENVAVANLTQHLRTRLLEHNIHDVEDLTGETTGPLRRRREQVMLIDANTLIALEISASMRRQETAYNTNASNPSVKGSLLSNIRRTVTKGGARLLAQWLSAPSTSLLTINRRQSHVALYHSRPFFLEDVRNLLRRGAGDISRALQRIITSRNDVQDLLEVRDFTKLCHDLVSMLKEEAAFSQRNDGRQGQVEGWSAMQNLVEAFVPLMRLSERLGEAIDENVIERRAQIQQDREREVELQVLNEAASQASDGKVKRNGSTPRKQSEESDDESFWGQPFEHLIRPASSKQISTLTKEHRLLRRRARMLEVELKERYNDRISLKHLLGQGFVVHMSDYRDGLKGVSTIEEEMSLAYKSKTTRTYYHEAFTKIGSRLMRVERELNDKEQVELQKLRLDVLLELGRLRKNSSLVNELDVLLGFAKLAQEMNFCRPDVNDGDEINIVGGRHLSVEMSLLHQASSSSSSSSSSVLPPVTRSFTPNDLHLHPQSRLHLITGPNMGGKSTLLRMISIITILAQIGSFVPAASCQIGIVDQIFSRIGAHDSINTEKSTFMVEMLEVAEFLKRSTRKSLIICDEIGRGTDHKTGIAIAFATALHLLDHVQCKCLFATHLYRVGDMLHGRSGVDFFCTDLKEVDGEISFSHKLRPGLNRNSHGLSIARLAGVPNSVLKIAQDTLDDLQNNVIE